MIYIQYIAIKTLRYIRIKKYVFKEKKIFELTYVALDTWNLLYSSFQYFLEFLEGRVFSCFFPLVLEVELSVLHMLSKNSTTELYPQPKFKNA